MNTENPYILILEKILTLEELNRTSQLLNEAYDGLYKSKSDPKEILETTLPYFVTDVVFETAKKNGVPFNDREGLQKIVDEIRTYLLNLPVAELVIAFIPNYRHIQKLSRWWEEYAGTHVILNIKIDESIVAGAKISYAGFYKDYSLSNWLNQNASSNLDQFI